jgi:hypothetical protein
VATRVTHVHGPPELAAGPDDCVVLCVVRNGSTHAAAFLEHYLALGVGHVVVLDNGSTDGTVDIASAYPSVTVLRSDLPFRWYEDLLRGELWRRYSRGTWTMSVDIDEFFDFPMSDRMGLKGLLAYLRTHRFTAMAAQMIDLFSDRPLMDCPGADEFRSACVWYDGSGMRELPYNRSENDVPDGITIRVGGIRREVFGSDNWLTKHPLKFGDGRVRPSVRTSHDCHLATVADVTGALLHYKFVAGFPEYVEDVVRRRAVRALPFTEYTAYQRILEADPPPTLMTERARRLEGVDQLVEEGLLVTSDRYRGWAAAWDGDRVDG